VPGAGGVSRTRQPHFVSGRTARPAAGARGPAYPGAVRQLASAAAETEPHPTPGRGRGGAAYPPFRRRGARGRRALQWGRRIRGDGRGTGVGDTNGEGGVRYWRRARRDLAWASRHRGDPAAAARLAVASLESE
jgi:hypothetical protein